MRICTRTLGTDESLVIAQSMQVRYLSFQMTSADGDNGTFIGNYTAVANDGATQLESQALTVSAGGGGVYTSPNANEPLDGITLTCNQGTMNVVLGF